MKNYEKETVEMLGSETFESFMSWTMMNGFEDYKTNNLKFGVNLTNLRVDGVEKGKHTNKGWTKIFNIAKLKTYFNLELLVDLKK